MGTHLWRSNKEVVLNIIRNECELQLPDRVAKEYLLIQEAKRNPKGQRPNYLIQENPSINLKKKMYIYIHIDTYISRHVQPFPAIPRRHCLWPGQHLVAVLGIFLGPALGKDKEIKKSISDCNLRRKFLYLKKIITKRFPFILIKKKIGINLYKPTFIVISLTIREAKWIRTRRHF